MKRFIFWVMVMLAGSVPTVPTYAESPIAITGEIRGRYEADKKSFDDGAHAKTFNLLRTRVGVLGEVKENASVFVQFQDSRLLGGRSDATLDEQSGTLNNGANVDVHQAFFQIDELWSQGPGLKAGRFELNLGNQRVFGAVGWHNVGRSWEGVIAFLERTAFRTDMFWLKRREYNDHRGNLDFDIIGANVAVTRLGAELLLVYEHDALDELERINIAGYLNRRFGNLQVISNGVVQVGSKEIAASIDQDISAFLLTGELIVHFDSPQQPRVSAGLDYASGDDEPDDDVHAYDNLYYTGHKFRGHMDYFVASRPEGLLDVIARGSISPAPGWRLGIDAHCFRSAAEYLTEAGEESNAIGAEFDLHASTTRVAGANIAGGASVFFPSDDFAGTDSEPGLWGYLMVTVAFGTDQ